MKKLMTIMSIALLISSAAYAKMEQPVTQAAPAAPALEKEITMQLQAIEQQINAIGGTLERAVTDEILKAKAELESAIAAELKKAEDALKQIETELKGLLGSAVSTQTQQTIAATQQALDAAKQKVTALQQEQAKAQTSVQPKAK